jgi:tetratricopeptide (TPR) repeat protein
MSRGDQALRRKRRKERRYQRQRERIFRQEGDFEDFLPPDVRVNGYTVTFDQLDREEESDPALDEALKDGREELYRKVGEEPAAAIPQLESLLARFPDSRVLMNWLAKAYAGNHQIEKSDAIVRRNYQLHPRYLFARLNYAQTLLRDGKTAEAAQVMDHKWDLKALHPDLDLFHITEFVSLTHLAVIYYITIGEFEAAHSIFTLLEQVVPGHEITKLLKPLVETSTLILALKLMTERRRAKGLLP